MTSLPEADPATRAFFAEWLETFSAFVREVDFASARPLFHDQIVVFGTHENVLRGLSTWRDQQWNSVWPRTTDFAFNLAETHVLLSDDASMATVISPWTSTGYTPDGTPFPRPGRATMVFHRTEAFQKTESFEKTEAFQETGGQWLCVHSHMSLNRGVPQTSHADRPVKAW